MEPIELKMEDRNTIKNLIILYNQYLQESQKSKMVSDIIGKQINIFNDELYEKYNIDKKDKIKLSQNYESFEVIKELKE